eukprot:13009277-Alexandrium_andersonii.AAC.1
MLTTPWSSCALWRSASISWWVRPHIGTWHDRRTGTAVRSSALSRFAFCGVPKIVISGSGACAGAQ